MDVKEAAKVAREYIIDVFGDEEIDHVGLEEVRFNNEAGAWEITIGFSRPWERNRSTVLPSPRQRSYKVVHIDDVDGRVTSVTHRVLCAVD